MKPKANRVVTYRQRLSGREATTVVTPTQYEALERTGRLVTDHGERGDGAR